MVFQNRQEAGQLLGEAVNKRSYSDPFVFGIPRGGVVVAVEVAKILKCPLDIVVVRKLGVPFDPELAFGAIGPEGELALEHDFVERIGLSMAEIEGVRAGAEEELKRRLKEYREERPFPEITGKTAILVDDGIATGSTILAGIRYLKKLHPHKVIVASPVCAPDSLLKIEKEAETVILSTPEDFAAVGQFYQDFPQTTDEEVKPILEKFRL